CQQHNGYPYSF
nr:immunoglobulin light chain junction region [Macaca mulatta]MOX08452.1 immunoglobulin light chain junction region [Macaca mulatta]